MAIAKKKKKVSKKKSAKIVVPKSKKKVKWQTKTKKKTKKKSGKNPNNPTKQKMDGTPFVPGSSGNPAGRIKGSTNRYSIKTLMDAIAKVEGKQGKPLLQHFISEAYHDKTVLVAVMKKVLPDLKSIESLVTSFESAMDDTLAKEIQDELKERYK